ncbi:vacuolar protein sorting protein [Striga asiatica]|uniref:Vacuolar protein sorting protein n=1 Tax=Striga asiatica TaxID=4170 RepID=A0A5A7QR57_STRAF|nr:vacuolar protein sorting protein [Striga asiatica]
MADFDELLPEKKRCLTLSRCCWTQAVKTILLQIPSLGKQVSAAAGYSKFVSSEMSKAEALLKGLNRTERQRILDDYNQHGARTNQPSIKPVFAPTSTLSGTPALANNNNSSSSSNLSTPVGIIPLKEEIVARAAALGRGATTGIRRILALIESTTKDLKDGPLRKLFIG